jgi:hypothetical protein
MPQSLSLCISPRIFEERNNSVYVLHPVSSPSVLWKVDINCHTWITPVGWRSFLDVLNNKALMQLTTLILDCGFSRENVTWYCRRPKEMHVCLKVGQQNVWRDSVELNVSHQPYMRVGKGGGRRSLLYFVCATIVTVTLTINNYAF